VRQHQRSTNTFGDFTGSIRTFQKPEEDQISSRKHLNQREEELKDMGGIPSFHKGKFALGTLSYNLLLLGFATSLTTHSSHH